MDLTPAWSKFDSGPIVFDAQSGLHYGIKEHFCSLHEEVVHV